MTKRTMILLAVMAVAASVWAVGVVYHDDISVTQANSVITFTDNGSGGTSAAFKARSIVVESLAASANTCYLDLKDTTATTADIALAPGGKWEWIATSGDGLAGIGAICAAGETATFRVTATR